MKLSHFNFDLPEELLAKFPAEHRDESRLMVLNRKEQTIEHKMFKDLIGYFDEGDVMILNNTKVFPARLFGNKEKTGARIEVFLLRELTPSDVLLHPVVLQNNELAPLATLLNPVVLLYREHIPDAVLLVPVVLV